MGQNLEDLAAMLESKAVRVVIDAIYPLADAGRAVAHIASRRARGKVLKVLIHVAARCHHD